MKHQHHIDRWVLAERSLGTAPSTIATYRSYLVRFDRDYGLVAATGCDVEEWFADHPWQAPSRKSARSALRAFYRWAVKHNVVPADPTAALDRIRMPRRQKRSVPAPIVERALATAEGDTWWAIRIAVTTGLRRSELAQLHSSHLRAHAEGSAVNVIGKGSHQRIVPVPTDVANHLAASDGWLFPSTVRPEEHVTGDHLYRWTLPFLSPHSIHGLRHVYATRVYRRTRDIHIVRRLLGHSSSTTTEAYIDDADDDGLWSAAASAWEAA